MTTYEVWTYAKGAGRIVPETYTASSAKEAALKYVEQYGLCVVAVRAPRAPASEVQLFRGVLTPRLYFAVEAEG